MAVGPRMRQPEPVRARHRLAPIMTAAPGQPSLEQLSGLVERVTFHNADSGFHVLRVKVRGERERVTLVGHTPSVTPGECAAASGSWVTEREHGRQFKAVFMAARRVRSNEVREARRARHQALCHRARHGGLSAFHRCRLRSMP